MALVGQANFQNFDYLDDNAVHWTKRGEDEAARAAIDGSSAGTGAPTWIDSSRMKVRHVVAVDPTTFRSKRVIVYTPTAYAAIALGSTISFFEPGSATAIAYTVTKKVAEKQPARGAARQVIDHA